MTVKWIIWPDLKLISRSWGQPRGWLLAALLTSPGLTHMSGSLKCFVANAKCKSCEGLAPNSRWTSGFSVDFTTLFWAGWVYQEWESKAGTSVIIRNIKLMLFQGTSEKLGAEMKRLAYDMKILTTCISRHWSGLREGLSKKSFLWRWRWCTLRWYRPVRLRMIRNDRFLITLTCKNCPKILHTK